MIILQKNMRAYVFILTGFLYLISCNAPRENPLDPLADNYQRTPSQKSIESYKFYSSFNNYYNQTNLFYETVITDSENKQDISQVILKCTGMSFRDTIIAKENGYGAFHTNFNLRDISKDLKPAELPELSFDLVVQSADGDSSLFSPYHIRRVIEQQLTPLTPVDSASGDTIHFSWEKEELDYFFTYNILLYHIQGGLDLVSEFKEIPADSTFYLHSGLPVGYYLWILQVEDRIGNLCQSNAIIFRYVN